MNGYRFLKAGARQKGVQTWAAIIKMEKKPLQVEVGTDMARRADGTAGHPEGSRSEHRRVEWGVTEESLGPLFEQFGVELMVDGFATAQNTRCSRFFSKGPQAGMSGIDCFSQRLVAGEVCPCCPPWQCKQQQTASEDCTSTKE